MFARGIGPVGWNWNVPCALRALYALCAQCALCALCARGALHAQSERAAAMRGPKQGDHDVSLCAVRHVSVQQRAASRRAKRPRASANSTVAMLLHACSRALQCQWHFSGACLLLGVARL